MKEWLNHTLTEAENLEFEQNGYFVVENALSTDMLDQLNALVNQRDAEFREQDSVAQHTRLNEHDLVGKADLFLELVDWPATFPKVWGILGWHIQLFHTQLVVTPPGSDREIKKRLGWHQDNNRMNRDFETPLHPRVSLKVAYFLTDTTEIGRANFYIVPGGHLENGVTYSHPDVRLPKGAVPTQVKAGDALIFDRRLWHAASPNITAHPRKMLFYGYSYRWLRSKSAMKLEHLYDQVNPIRRQLLGYATSANGYFSPQDEDVPLREWVREHLGEEAVVR